MLHPKCYWSTAKHTEILSSYLKYVQLSRTKRNRVTTCRGNVTEKTTSNFRSCLLSPIPFHRCKCGHEQVVTGKIWMHKAALPIPLFWASLTCQLCAANASKAICPHCRVLKSHLSKFPYNMFLSKGRQWNLFFLNVSFWGFSWVCTFWYLGFFWWMGICLFVCFKWRSF